MLLTTLNNVGSKTLFNAVFNRPEQVVRFWLCKDGIFENMECGEINKNKRNKTKKNAISMRNIQAKTKFGKHVRAFIRVLGLFCSSITSPVKVHLVTFCRIHDVKTTF